ncbi:cilia- and flagella-associated protein 54-like [Scomber scombrus]|uniref:Cilia- and flagella-associated protein 54-like n=1 Tax=Scomber scombrus TaxID=13677 RepID=A0AAV1N358_SCOSC
MDFPASYYGKLDKRNPVISAFERDINSFITLMRRVASSTSSDNSSYAKGIKILVEIWRNYKHRLPSKLYQEHMLQIADFLCGIKLYQLALWHGYSLHLLQFSSVNITDITDVDHLMTCFFPEGFDTDQDTLDMKICAMLGCVQCVFELEKGHSILGQKGLCKLLQVLNFIRIMMQAFQQHEHLCWHIYNGSLHIYNICRYLMTMNCSAQALEYLLWASISLELSVPLMTAKYLPWIVTLYCAVCHCYYDNLATVQAEEFARRALGKINDLAELEQQSGVLATRETQRAFKEASIKLAAMMFKRAVFEARKRPKNMFRVKTKSTLKDIPNVPWPRNTTERMLMGLFDSKAAQFLGILETLWDSTKRPLHTRVSDEPELQELVLELLSAGISILSGYASEQKRDDPPCMSLSAMTSTSPLMDLAITGENKVSFMSAVRFIKLLFQYKQPDAFTQLAGEMLQVLSGAEGQSYRKAETELAVLYSFNSLQSSQRSHPREDSIINGNRHKSSVSMSDEFIGLVDALHKSVCGFAPEVQPDGDLVLEVVLFLWGKVKVVMQKDQLQNSNFEKVDNYHKWVWCLYMLCEVAFAFELATVDCIMTAEMIHTLAILLESAAERNKQTHCPANTMCCTICVCLQRSSTELLQKVCEVVKRGLEALAKGVATLMPQNCSSITDFALMQKFSPIPLLTSPRPSSEDGNGGDETSKKEKEVETKAESDIKSSRHTQSTCVSLLATDLHLELHIIHCRAFLKLLQLNAVVESDLLDQIKKNKVSKALFLMQKALLVYNSMEPNKNSKTKFLLEEASTLIEKAGVEERKLYMSTTPKAPAENQDKGLKEEKENPPPPPILLSCTDHSLTFTPAPYYREGQVCWYQLCGRAAEGINRKVRLGDYSLPGTGNLVPAVSGECVLRVEGLEPNQKYMFAVAAYNSQGKLLGNSIGETTFPLLASMPTSLLSTWAHLAQMAFQTEQYDVAKRACRELWSHYTFSDPHSTRDRLATTGLHIQTLQHSSPLLCQLFLTSIFIETEINIQQGSLYCDSSSDNGLFIWEQEARLAECERMLVAIDVAMWLSDSSAALQAVVSCYSLLAPLIFHQIACDPVVQVLTKCLIVLEENSALLKQKWTGNTSESLIHMIACITYYLSKVCMHVYALRVLKEPQRASALMDCGRTLLQDVFDAQLQISRVANKAVGVRHSGKVLIYLMIYITPRMTRDEMNVISRPLTGCEDPAVLYDRISSSTLKDAYQDVMKLRRKAYFIEFAALLIQRTMEEGHTDLVLKWGQTILEFLCRRDEVMGLSTKCLEGNGQSKRKSSVQTLKGNEPPQNTSSHDDVRKRLKQKMPPSMLQKVKTNRYSVEMQAVENLLTLLSSVVQRHKKQFQLRNMCCEERVWKSHLNYSLAHAHLAVFYQALNQLLGGDLQHRYSQLNPLCFSLAYTGILVQRRNSQQQSSKCEVVSERDSSHSVVRDYVMTAHKDRNKKEEARVHDSPTDKSYEQGEDPSQSVHQQLEIQKRTSALLLDSLKNAALHLRRAMVLAHRGSHWTTLQTVCQTAWDQNCRIAVLIQRAAQVKPPFPLTADQLHTTFTPLLVLSTDLIMDMLNRLGLWSLYDSDLTEEELESSLHFSGPLDDSTQVDLRWVRTLVLHTLERLHDSGKWESLAHFALLFNSYTRERYALMVTPLLVLTQRRLLERISCFGGPAVPQPHHVKTEKATGKQVTYRSYVGCQLLSGWTLQSLSRKKAPLTNLTPRDTIELKGAGMQHSMSLVCVPLDVEDTLRCYRQALERRPHCLHVFQHSRSLLMLLLAYTQSCFAAQLRHCQSRSVSHSASLVDFSPMVMPTPNIQPCDLTEEDYTTPKALYSLPVSPDHMPTVIAAYSTSIKYLEANSHDSLRVLALHEMGNLHFYNGNTRAAYSYWSKAVDSALQNSGVVEKWDGVSFGGGTLQQILKQAGIWGCLQAAGLTAKIAQYILTSDISQRTKCCLLSAHLFKCVLCCSLAQPQADLQYASHSIGDELLPGVDLFSEPHRVHLGTTVTSLNFICHWLFTTGYHITLLPMLALYLYFVGTVCRDVQHFVEGKILKIQALTELCLFTEAIKEAVQVIHGTGVCLPNGHYINQDNLQALEELVNCDIAPEVGTVYGSTLCLRFNLARIQLVLALSNTVYGPPLPVTSEHHEQDRLDCEGSCLKTEEPKVLALDSEKEKLTPGRIKFLLLEAASSLLPSIAQKLTSQPCSETENLELAIESKLLKANLFLQQGHASLSSEMAVSSLMLLQMSPLMMSGSMPGSEKPASGLPHALAESEQGTKDCTLSSPLHGDCSRAVEANERIGVALWLRCRLALFRSLAAQIPDTTVHSPGLAMCSRMLQEGLDECALWGDIDIRALLMVEGAKLEEHRGKTDDSMALLQEAVSLLSGRACMPPGSSVTLAQATLLLSDLRGTQSTTLLQLTQKLLQKQLSVFGESVVLDDGKNYFSPPGPSNTYLPYLHILDETTLRIGRILDLSAMETLVPAQSSQSTSRQHLLQSSQIERDSQAPIPLLSNSSTSSPTSPPCSAALR